MMELSIVKTVLDGIQVIGSLVGTRKDLQETFQFGAEGLVVPVVQKRPVEDAVAIFDEMEKGQIQGRMVTRLHPLTLLETYFKSWNALPNLFNIIF